MSGAAQSEALSRFVSHLQAVIGRVHGLPFATTAQLLAEVHPSIPSELNGAGHCIVQALLLRTACELEILNHANCSAAAFARRLLSLCEARTPETLREEFGAYLKRVVAGVEVRSSTRHDPPTERSEASDDPRVAAMVTFIQRQYARPSLDTAEAAASVRLSRWHASRLLHRETGHTFRELLLQVRMQEARHQLHHGFLTVKEIAGAVGYSSVAAFSRQFKRSSGLSPSEWRSNAVWAPQGVR